MRAGSRINRWRSDTVTAHNSTSRKYCGGDSLYQCLQVMHSVLERGSSSKKAPDYIYMRTAKEMKKTHLDLCGCVLFPGSSNVHAEFDVRHD